MPDPAEIARVVEQTGMEPIQAIYHLRARAVLRDRAANRETPRGL